MNGILIRILAFAFIAPSCAFAQDSQTKVPDQLKSKSVTISYSETRKAAPEDGGQIITRTVPFKLILYVSADGNLFNRLLSGKSTRSSDQTKGEKDITKFADRETTFDKQKMTVTNHFGSRKGLRVIEAVFNEKFTSCTATVTISVIGDYARRRLVTGGFERLYSASTSDIACAVVDGNVLVN